MSIVVMAHPARLRAAARLARSVRAREVIVDPGFDPGGLLPAIGGVVIPPSALRCARWAWRAAAVDGEWACVVQDDALPCLGFGPDLVDRVYRDANAEEPTAVSFYYGSQSATARRIRGRRGPDLVERDPADTYVSTVALVVPSVWVSSWLDYSRTAAWADSVRDDECWGAFCDDNDHLTLATTPCLVDHDNTIPSVAGNAAHGSRFAAVPPPQGVPAW